GRDPHARLAGKLNLDHRLGAYRLIHGSCRGGLGRRDQHLGEAVTPGELLPPPVDLIGTDLRPACHIGDNRTRLQARRDNRALLFVAPPPPTLRAGDYLNSHHRTVANTGANTAACTDAEPARTGTAAQGGRQRTVTFLRWHPRRCCWPSHR